MNISDNVGVIGSYPKQKLLDKEKTKDWYKNNVNSALSLIYLDQNNDKHKMNVYANLDNDIIDIEEIEKVFNPLDIQYASFPASLKNYPLAVPKIDLLQGEELSRSFDFSVKNNNPDTYSNYQTESQEMLMQILISELTSEQIDENKLEAKIQKLDKYLKYEWKDVHEITATRILQHLFREQNLQYKFNKAFRDALVMGQEIYRVDISGNEPSVNKCDPRKVYTIRRGHSEEIENADIIVELDYSSVGAVIDEFYDYLTSDEISTLEGARSTTIGAGSVLDYKHEQPMIYSNINNDGDGVNGFKDISGVDGLFTRYNNFPSPYDKYGNVRVVRVRWRGRRKVGKLTFFDEITGDEDTKLVPEGYEPNKSLGEHVEWLWINEAYEATLLGSDIYVKCQPREIQMRHFDNISKCFLGYVGTDYGKSLMSRMESYQYIYNVYMRRLELVMSKYKGPIYELDPSKIPDEWDMDKWMYYADVLGWAVVDPFNEGKKGAATGKLAGTYNTTGKVLDPNIGNYIQQIISMLQYIENQMGEISGVNKQRLGQIDNRETVGGVERAVSQSSHITEKLFFVHDDVKRRVLHALLDTAKYAWAKVKSKKLNYVLDDMSRVFLEFNPSDIASSEFDLFISNTRKDLEVKQVVRSLAQAGIQNGLGMGPMIKALREDSVTAMARIIEDAEEKSYQRQSESIQAQQQSVQAQTEAELQKFDKSLELDYYKVDTDAQLRREEMQVKLEISNNDDNDINEKKLDLDERKQQLEERKLNSTETKNSNDTFIKQEQVKEAARHNKEKEIIDRKKSQIKK
jgi:hypothetical protein